MRTPVLSTCRAVFLSCVCFAGGVCAQDGSPGGGVRLFVPADVYSAAYSRAASPAEVDDPGQHLRRMLAALEEDRLSDALQSAAWALRSDPDSERPRWLLGFQRVGDYWAGGFAARRIERGEVWTPRYGWVRPTDIRRMDAGERRVGNRWVSAEDDAQRHARIDRGWVVRTDHFSVQTNDSLQTAAELAVRLERLHSVWEQLFAEYCLTKADLRKRLDEDRQAGYRSKPFQVVCYATRDEYNSTLRRKQPRIEKTIGIYFDDQRRSYFFAGEEQDPGTVLHEVTHQLFQESKKVPRGVGVLANTWAIEGVACYMESIRPLAVEPAGLVVSVGGAGDGRLPAAIQRRLVDGYYVPLAELVTLGTTDLQRRPDLPQLYSQSAGLATFFMQHEDGKYRHAFVEYLGRIYAGRDTPQTLAQLTGRSYTQLDAEYEQFLREAARQLQSQSQPAPASPGP